MLLLAVLVLLLNVSTVFASDRVSPIDEQYWINHLINGSELHIVTPGEQLDQETLRELCSRNSQLFDWPPCPEGHIDDGSPWAYKSVDISGHSPFYFFATGGVARVLRATPVDLPPNDSLVTWGRLLGSAWLLLGCYFALRAAELLGLTRRWVVVALFFLIATPDLLHMSTIVNPDQTAFASGAAVLWAGLAWERSGRRLWLVGLTALVAGLLDQTNSIAILVVLLYLALRLLQRRRQPDDGFAPSLRAHVGFLVVSLVAIAVAYKGWDRLDDLLHNIDVIKPRSRLADISDNPVRQEVTRVEPTIGRAFGGETVTAMFPPWSGTNSWVPPIMRSTAFDAFTSLSVLVAIGAMGATLFTRFLRDRLGTLATATVVALLVSPSLIVLNDWWAGGTFLRPPPRYGLSALPMIAMVIAAVSERTKVAAYAVGAVAVGLYASALLSLAL